MCAEFAGSLLICFSIYIMCSFGSAFYNVNLAYIALGTGVVYAAMTAIFAKVSGAQFNPAITVAAMLTSKTRAEDPQLRERVDRQALVRREHGDAGRAQRVHTQ